MDVTVYCVKQQTDNVLFTTQKSYCPTSFLLKVHEFLTRFKHVFLTYAAYLHCYNTHM